MDLVAVHKNFNSTAHITNFELLPFELVTNVGTGGITICFMTIE